MKNALVLILMTSFLSANYVAQISNHMKSIYPGRFALTDFQDATGKAGVSLLLDGEWKKKRSEKSGNFIRVGDSFLREYRSIPNEEVDRISNHIRRLLGSNDVILEVRNVKFEREEEFRSKDRDYFVQKRLEFIMAICLSFLGAVFIASLIYRIVGMIQLRKSNERNKSEGKD